MTETVRFYQQRCEALERQLGNYRRDLGKVSVAIIQQLLYEHGEIVAPDNSGGQDYTIESHSFKLDLTIYYSWKTKDFSGCGTPGEFGMEEVNTYDDVDNIELYIAEDGEYIPVVLSAEVETEIAELIEKHIEQ